MGKVLKKIIIAIAVMIGTAVVVLMTLMILSASHKAVQAQSERQPSLKTATDTKQCLQVVPHILS